ncbi:MAG: TetR family transcriptional regulator [Beutenbergiaceae bacterium]
MRSTPVDDLTTRARLREASVARFAADGFSASLRTIAADAGVSAGLIVHLFGSKDGLRQACDEHVFTRIREAKLEVLDQQSGPGMMLHQLAQIDSYAPLVTYVVRSLADGGEHARTFIEHMIADAVEYVRAGVQSGQIVPSRDEEARVRYLTLSNLGPLVLELSLNPPPDAITGAAQIRAYFDSIMLPTLELMTEGFLADRSFLDTYLLYLSDPPAGTAPATPSDQQKDPS